MDQGDIDDAQSELELIAELTSDVVVRINLEGILTYVSRSVCVYGYKPEDLIGTSGISLFHPDDQEKIAANAFAVLSDTPMLEEEDFQRRLRKADGTWTWVEGSPIVRRDAAGSPVELIGVFRNVSRRRAAEESSREQSQLFEAAFAHSAIGKCIVDLEGRLLRVNPAQCRMSGYSEAELFAMGPKAFDNVETFEAMRLTHTPRLLAGEVDSYACTTRSRRADGTFHWVELTVALVRESDGSPRYFVVEIQDLTEAREAKARLEESELRFRLIAENTSDVIVVSDLEGRFTFVGPSVRWLGYEPSQLLGRSAADHTHPDDIAAVIKAFARLMRPRASTTEILRLRWRGRHGVTGEWLWIESSPGLIRDPVTGEQTSFIDVLRDISAQVRQEEALAAAQAEALKAAEALRESERLYRMIAENMTDLVVQADSDDRLVYASPSVRLYGYEPRDLIGIHADDLLHPDDVADSQAERALAEAGKSPSTQEGRPYRYRAANGDWVWLEGNPKELHDGAGQNIGTLNVLRNVTESRAQAELFEAAFTHAPVAMALTGLEGTFIRVNRASRRLLGYAETPGLELHAVEIGHPDEAGLDDHLNAQLLTGEIDRYEVERRFRNADGTYKWVQIAISVVRNVDGSPKYYVSHTQDLSARKQAEAALQESEARYRMIAETTSDIIVVSDRSGRITYLSPSARQLGFEPQELLGQTFTDYTHPDDFPRIRDSLRRQSPGQLADRIRWRARHKMTGDWVWLESMPIRLWDPESGEPTGYLDVMRDVSVQVRQEEALAKARAEAEAAASVKSQFLANMSHEIRTPLTAVLGYSDILTRAPGLDEKARRTVQRIAGAGSALLAIVNDILDFSKLEAGQVDVRPAPTDLADVVTETLALFENPAEAKALSLSADLDPSLPAVVMLDADRLRQVLVNLIGNAVKFTERGQVTVRVAPKCDGQMLHFEVEDTGPGLDPDQCAVLFQRFNQVDGSTTRRHGGTGLGLAICKGLVEAMGGEIGVTSRLSIGSTFHFTLPLAAAELAVAPSTTLEVSALVGARVLVIDDNDTNRDLARLILEALSMTVNEADGGATALVRLAEDTFDVVLLDLRMPDLDGPEVLRRLREQTGPNRETPVLAFTADATRGHGSSLENFDGVVLKPISAMALAESLAEALTRRRPAAVQERVVAQG